MAVGEKRNFYQFIHDSNFEKIFIPMIQRDYVQGRNSVEVENLREDLIRDFKEAILQSDKTVDLNFVFGKIKDKSFIPIDGQQRLTTLFLLYAYAFAKENDIENLNFLKTHFIYATRITTSRFLEKLLENLPQFFIDSRGFELKEYIQNAYWYVLVWNNDPSIISFLVMLNEIHKNFYDVKNLKDILISDQCPIYFMALSIENMGKENDLYIKMNSRGKLLTSFESFKSNLFEYLDHESVFQREDFKKNVDDWQYMIWKSLDHFDENETEKARQKVDEIILNLMLLIIINRAFVIESDVKEDENLQEIISNDSMYLFDSYVPYLQNGKALEDIYDTFSFLTFLSEYEEEFLSIMNIIFDIVENTEWKERVRLFMITSYAVKMDGHYDLQQFRNYLRVVTNLINNTVIDKIKLAQNACKSIEQFEESMYSDVENYFANIGKNIPFFSQKQTEEETKKCQLICYDPKWKEALVNAERNTYFKGEIAFALKLAGIKVIESDNNLAEASIEKFNSVWDSISKLFGNEGLFIDETKEKLFHRALLTFGDYSIQTSSTILIKTFFFEGKKGYFNWRDMLREEKSFPIFEKFFRYFQEKIESEKNIEKILEQCIDNYSDSTNEFIYYLIKKPSLFLYMEENKYRIDDNRILLFSKATSSANYVEFHTYVVKKILEEDFSINVEYQDGKGNGDTTGTYILHIDHHPCHIEYNGKYVDQNGEPLKLKSGEEVTTVEQAVQYGKEFIENKTS